MHNTKKDLRKNLERFKKKLLDRNFKFDIKLFDNLDNINRKLISKKKCLNNRKKLSKSNDKSNYAKSKEIFEEISKISNEQIIAEKNLMTYYIFTKFSIRRCSHIGKDEKSNKLIKQVRQN